ncbi:MAG: SLBB domain-containing protein, partial [Campylobacterales bacterium]|nr:SLBB domain-containing protein [Campylobacterales bacterium]
PEYYILSSGDLVAVYLYGDTSKEYKLEINNEGDLNFPTLGPIKVGGLSFKDAKTILISKLKESFKNSEVLITIEKYSTIQVTLVGEVKYPGIYNLPSFATIKELLLSANGINDVGSLREIELKRDNAVHKFDLYELISKGIDLNYMMLRHGDIVLVPKSKKEVELRGFVNKEAKFELKDGENLSDLINLAGGLKPNASKFGCKIERFEQNQQINVLEVELTKESNIEVKHGDKIFVYSLDDTNKNFIFLYGNVVKPGSRELSKSTMSLNALLSRDIKNIGLNGLFLDNTYFEYALLKRKNKNDLSHEIISFNLLDVINKKKDIKLQKDDEIYILNYLDIYYNPYVEIKGNAINNIGKHQYYEGMKLKDLIYNAGIKMPIDKSKIKVTTFNTKDLMPKVLLINLENEPDFKLSNRDIIEVYDYYSVNPIPKVEILGNVYIQGSYELGKNMKIMDLIKVAGGLKKDTFMNYLRLVRTINVDGEKFDTKEFFIDVTKVLENDPLSNIDLKDKDIVKIYHIDELNDERYSVINGEVRQPGKYKIGQNTTVLELIKSSGGLTDKASKEKIEIVRYSVINGI